jgi:hypothetical protein
MDDGTFRGDEVPDLPLLRQSGWAALFRRCPILRGVDELRSFFQSEGRDEIQAEAVDEAPDEADAR